MPTLKKSVIEKIFLANKMGKLDFIFEIPSEITRWKTRKKAISEIGHNANKLFAILEEIESQKNGNAENFAPYVYMIWEALILSKTMLADEENYLNQKSKNSNKLHARELEGILTPLHSYLLPAMRLAKARIMCEVRRDLGLTRKSPPWKQVQEYFPNKPYKRFVTIMQENHDFLTYNDVIAISEENAEEFDCPKLEKEDIAHWKKVLIQLGIIEEGSPYGFRFKKEFRRP